jgi:diguanylate cyclase (GGDEF)-like protein
MAYQDGLTGLANRLAFNNFLEQQIQDAHEFILFYIDMDKFKQMNDTYGHHTGDIVLKTIATEFQ